MRKPVSTTTPSNCKTSRAPRATFAYGSCAGEAEARAQRAKDYLVNTRGIDAGRLVTVDGGCRSDLSVELWIVPTGATAPAASTDNIISPCPECKKAAPRRKPRSRRGGRMDE